jgi:hypothetical protein
MDPSQLGNIAERVHNGEHERMRRDAATLRNARSVLTAWALLSVCVTARLPFDVASIGAALRPSLDVAAALLLASYLAWGGVSVQLGWIGALTLVSVVTRAYLIADGVTVHYLGRPFHLFADLPLLAEFVRLLHSISGAFGVAAIASALCLGFWGLWRLVHRLWRTACDRLADAFARRTLAGVALVLVLASFVSTRTGFAYFAAPALPVVADEMRNLLRVQGLYDDGSLAARRSELLRRIAKARHTLEQPPAPAPVPAPDVYLFLIEAYGHTVFTTPEYLARLSPRLHASEQVLRAAGFKVCSAALIAPTFGGGSWYTHATLETGVRVSDGFDYDNLLSMTGVPTLARMFARAGYRSVSVKPGTTRESPQTAFYGFEIEYSAANLGYAGRNFAWAPMPDQYVLDAIRKRELQQRDRPLFIEYALVSSHYPFEPRPPYYADWPALGNGSIFIRPDGPMSVASAGVSHVASAYLDSIEYDMQVVTDYVARNVDRPALVIVMGDHQPTAGIAGTKPSWGVPLHIISRDPAFLRPWYARGCQDGLLPKPAPPRRAIEQWMPQLAADLGLSAEAR